MTVSNRTEGNFTRQSSGRGESVRIVLTGLEYGSTLTCSELVYILSEITIRDGG